MPARPTGPSAIAAERLHKSLAAFTLDDLGQMPVAVARKFIRLRSDAEIAVARLQQQQAREPAA